MRQDPARAGWRSLLRREWIATLAVLLGGVLLQSMNVLMLTTVLPSIAGELGGVAMLSWPTTAFLASSIVAASCAGMLAAAVGARAAYCVGVTTFLSSCRRGHRDAGRPPQACPPELRMTA